MEYTILLCLLLCRQIKFVDELLTNYIHVVKDIIHSAFIVYTQYIHCIRGSDAPPLITYNAFIKILIFRNVYVYSKIKIYSKYI